MNNEHFNEKISALKREIAAGSADENIRQKLEDLLMLQRQADVVPVELILEESSVVKRYPITEAIEIVRCKSAIFFHATGFWVVSKPTLANNMKGGALYEMLEWYCDYMDERDEYMDEERENFDAVCAMIVNILDLPMDAFTDMDYCMNVAHEILKHRTDYYNRLADEAAKGSGESLEDAIADAVYEAEHELGKEMADELHGLAEKDRMKN